MRGCGACSGVSAARTLPAPAIRPDSRERPFIDELLTNRGDHEKKDIWIANPKQPGAPCVGRLGFEYGPRGFDATGDGIDVLRRRDLHRESVPLRAVQAFRP